MSKFMMLLYLTYIVLIVPISVNEQTTIYLSTLLSVVFIIFSLLDLKGRKYNKQEKNVVALVILYTIASLASSLVFYSYALVFTLNKVIPLIIFISFIGKNNYYNLKLSALYKFVFYMTNFIIICSLIIFLFGYSGIRYSSGRLLLVPTSEFLYSFGEPRLFWIFTHKSRFALFCTLNLGMLLIRKDMGNYQRGILVLLTLMASYFSSTKTILAINIAIASIYYFKQKSEDKRSNYLKASIVAFCLVIVVWLGNSFINSLSNVRDVESAGGRIYIWEAGIKKVYNNFYGIGQFDQFNWLTTPKLPGGIYTHAHNIFINELIERGVIPGSLYILIYFSIIKLFNKRFINIIFIGCALSGVMDNTISSEMPYIFWPIIFLLYAYSNYNRDNGDEVYY